MACLIYFHGGGFFAGNVDMYDYYLNTISIQLNIVVISVEYRLCPEHMYPAAIEDCWNVVQFYIENSQLFNTDLNRTIIGGDSAGANLTSVITQRIAENESISFRPKFVIYITPFFQLFNLELPSIRRYFPCGIISYFSFYTGKR
jgi:acetyl esterase/lipase